MSHATDARPFPAQKSLRRFRLWTASILAVIFLAAVVLYYFPPTEYTFYPRCLLYDTTGLHCPGCGGTRCVYALLHGDVAQAAAYNVLVLLCLPYIALHAANAVWRALAGRQLFRWHTPAWWPKVAAVVFVLFLILRNLPFAPFTYLAPHKL